MFRECGREDSNVKTVLRAFEESHCEQSHCYEALFFLELKQKHCCKPLGKPNLPQISHSLEKCPQGQYSSSLQWIWLAV